MSNNILFVLGAAVVGIVGAAGMFIMEHFREERRKHELARLNQQLTGMQQELNLLRQLQAERKPTRSKRSRHEVSKSISTASGDSSDLEFYDLSDDDEGIANPLEQTLKEVDDQLNIADGKVIKTALDRLLSANVEHSHNCEILWRLGKAYHKLSATVDDSLKQDYANKGIDSCQAAIDINPNLVEPHKWFAILVGLRSNFQSIQGKISDGYLFKQHIDAAIVINPNDETLHHMLGRFTYETANLKWYERKVAATFFAEPPNGTFDEALEHFQTAERLLDKDWKENKLMIAKCQIAMGKYAEAVKSLQIANNMINDSLDTAIDSEVQVLLQKYNSYS